MTELIKLLPEIILYLVLGFIFIRTYRFIRINKNPDDYKNILIEILISGFILRKLFAIIPLNLNKYIDTIGMIIGSFFFGIIIARFVNSKLLDNVLSVFKIRQTVNYSFWNDIEDKDAAIYIEVIDHENNIGIDGKLVLYEAFTRQPLIQLSAYRKSKDNKIINDFSNQPERTILIDTSKYKDLFITYDKNSKKTESWK